MVDDELLLARILAPGGLSQLFQPIVEVDGEFPSVHGWEGLVRGPAGTNVEGADVLFDYVRRKHAEAVMDRRCIETLFEAASRCCVRDVRLAVNVHASTLGRDPEFVEWMVAACSNHGLDIRRVTVEIVEHAPACNSPLFHFSLERIRAAGAVIALDDVGLGQSNFRMILDVRPEIFKVDRHIAAGCTDDPHRQAVLESIVGLASRFGGRVVAEGIETVEDLRTVRELGVGLVQGYLFSRPRKPAELDPAAFTTAWWPLLEASRPRKSAAKSDVVTSGRPAAKPAVPGTSRPADIESHRTSRGLARASMELMERKLP